jgi:hypothetical protein
MTTQPPNRGQPAPMTDASMPVLLLVALVAMSAVVVAIVAVSRSDSSWALVVAIAVVLVGMVTVTATITRQLSDLDGDVAPPGVADAEHRHEAIEPKPHGPDTRRPARREEPHDAA